MTRIWKLTVALGLIALSSASFAFEEQKMPAGKSPVAGQQTPVAGSSQGIKLTDPGVTPPKLDSGTKIRVPGLGVIGEIPKMDFGLELLYGASQPKQVDRDGNEASGVMGRVTVPLKSR